MSTAGTIGFNDDGSFSFPENVARSDISLSNDALVDVTGTTGGDLSLTAGNITIEGDSELQGGTFANTGAPDSQSGDINLQATEAIKLDASTIDNAVGTGNAGEVEIIATNFSIVNDGQIDSSTLGNGDAGNITIDVSEKVSLDIGNIVSNILEEAEGNAGEIKVSANSISLTNGAQIQSGVFEGGQGNGNNVTLNARGGDVTISGNNQVVSGIFTDVDDG
ncbi:MAG: hypothetical protein HC930_09850 [Hydrococcus sp. SU_1_0]|nr:hypothetical protein [Hydrococcus sp. SU_1_0]